MDFSRWPEIQQPQYQHHQTNPTSTTDPYQQFYNAQASFQQPPYPHYSHPSNPNSNLNDSSAAILGPADAAIRPPGIDPYAPNHFLPHAGFDGMGAAPYGHPQVIPAGPAMGASQFSDPTAQQPAWGAAISVADCVLDANTPFPELGTGKERHGRGITEVKRSNGKMQNIGIGRPGNCADCLYNINFFSCVICKALYKHAHMPACNAGRPMHAVEQMVGTNPNAMFGNSTIHHFANGTMYRRPKKTKVVQSAWCEICKIDCNSKDVLDKHQQGKKHKRNVQILEESKKGASVAIKPSNPVVSKKETSSSKGKTIAGQAVKRVGAPAVQAGDNLETKRRKLMEGGAPEDSVRVCPVCNVACNSETVFKFHMAGQKHAAQVKKKAAMGMAMAAAAGPRFFTAI